MNDPAVIADLAAAAAMVGDTPGPDQSGSALQFLREESGNEVNDGDESEDEVEQVAKRVHMS